jgi:hypothetical protein
MAEVTCRKKMLIGFSKGFRLVWSVPMIHFDIRNCEFGMRHQGLQIYLRDRSKSASTCSNSSWPQIYVSFMAR